MRQFYRFPQLRGFHFILIQWNHKARSTVSHLVNAVSSFKIVYTQQCKDLSMSRDTDYLVVVFNDLHLQFFQMISKHYLRKTQYGCNNKGQLHCIRNLPSFLASLLYLEKSIPVDGSISEILARNSFIYSSFKAGIEASSITVL